MGEKKSTEPGIVSKGIKQSPDAVTPSNRVNPSNQPEQPVEPAPEGEDWRMNREWCLNQALEIVKSLQFETKDVPTFLEAVYRKIVELADDARKRKGA